MTALRFLLKELAAFFFGGTFLAAGIFLVLAAAWFLQESGAGAIAGALLFLGCPAVLIASVLNGRRQ